METLSNSFLKFSKILSSCCRSLTDFARLLTVLISWVSHDHFLWNRCWTSFSFLFSFLCWCERESMLPRNVCQIFTCSWFKADWCLVPSLMTVLIPTFKYWRVTIVSYHSSGILVAWCKDSSTKTTSSSVFFFSRICK